MNPAATEKVQENEQLKEKTDQLLEETVRIKNSFSDFLLFILRLEQKKSASLIQELDRIKKELLTNSVSK